MRELKIEKNDAGQRLDKFLTKALDLPTSLMYKSIRTKKIKVNRKRAEISLVLSEGDLVQCFLAEEFFAKLDSDVKAPNLSKIKNLPKIIYEDENILLINKEAGISVHRTSIQKPTPLSQKYTHISIKRVNTIQIPKRALPLLCATELTRTLQV